MKIQRFFRNFPKKLICSVVVLLSVLCCFHWSSERSLRNVSEAEKDYLETATTAKPQFIDIDALKLAYSSEICLYTKPKIVILITSHVSNSDTRNIIRRSRPRDLFEKFNVQMIFLVAILWVGYDNRNVEKESRKYGDLVQGEFIEAYHNLTWKHLMGFRWVRDYCKTASLVVKMDDDIVVNFYKLVEIINKFRANFDLLGHRIAGMKPIRDITNKWYVSEGEFAGNEYPTFLSGWLYAVTTKSVASILNISKTVPYFWIDDVFVSGIIREKANLKLTDISQHFRYEPKNIECCIMNKYSCDFLAAPNGKKSILHLKLSDHLWECRYKKLCLLESNMQESCWFTSNSSTEKTRWIVKKLDT